MNSPIASTAFGNDIAIEPWKPSDLLKEIREYGSLTAPKTPAVDRRLPHVGPAAPILPDADPTIASVPSAADPLDFVSTTLDDAVDRINNEYFFRRDNSEICRQNAATGEIQVLTPQQLKTALAGRWVDAIDPKSGKMKTREAATVWLEKRTLRGHRVLVANDPKRTSPAAQQPVGPRNGHISMFSRDVQIKAWLFHGCQTGSFNDNLHIAFRTLPEFAKHLAGPTPS